MNTEITLNIDTVKLILKKYHNIESFIKFRIEHLKKITHLSTGAKSEKLKKFQGRIYGKSWNNKIIHDELIKELLDFIRFVEKNKVRNTFGDSASNSLTIPAKDLYLLDQQLDEFEKKKRYLESFLTEEELELSQTPNGRQRMIAKYQNIINNEKKNTQIESEKVMVDEVADINDITSLINYWDKNGRSKDFIQDYFDIKDKIINPIKATDNSNVSKVSFNILRNAFKNETNEGIFANLGFGFLVFGNLNDAESYQRELKYLSKNEGDHFVTLNRAVLSSSSLILDNDYTIVGSYKECLFFLKSLFIEGNF